MAGAGGHRATASSWIAVMLIIAAFVIGTFALILSSVPLWIVAGITLAVGLVMSLTSKLMEQAH